MKVIFLGPPGAGKGTQAQRISEEANLIHISTGDLLRRAVKLKEPLGSKVQKYIDRGDLVPDEIVTEIVKTEVREANQQGFILDGFPRNIFQAKALEEILSKEGHQINLVVDFDIPIEMVRERLSGRRVCIQCGTNFNLKNLPPGSQGLCKRCGGQLAVRLDDSNQTVSQRIQVYEKNIAALREHYQEHASYQKVSAESPPEEQYQGLKKFFGLNSK
jgi:adenylate kinase